MHVLDLLSMKVYTKMGVFFLVILLLNCLVLLSKTQRKQGKIFSNTFLLVSSIYYVYYSILVCNSSIHLFESSSKALGDYNVHSRILQKNNII